MVPWVKGENSQVAGVCRAEGPSVSVDRCLASSAEMLTPAAQEGHWGGFKPPMPGPPTAEGEFIGWVSGIDTYAPLDADCVFTLLKPPV